MTQDYKHIGLKCGLEIHQQLAGKKLFSTCDANINEDDDPHSTISRELRPVIGETGEVDQAAAQAKRKQFIYRSYPKTCSLVELDEEPPQPMNQEALYTTLQLAHLMKMDIVDEVQVMRKTVIDGSNTSGFQRTALVGLNGILPSSLGDVRVSGIAVEEDAAKIINRSADIDEYNLSRLGIPLIEIGTEPDIKTPEQCQEVAKHIGMLLRSTGRVRRGLGTIRQDVNVSIKGGNRVEIKGAQDLAMVPTLVEIEAARQQKIIALKHKLNSLKIGTDKTLKELTTLFATTQCQFVHKAIGKGTPVIGFKVINGEGVLGEELQPGKRLATDFSDYAKVHTGIGGIIHSDENLSKYKFSEDEIENVKSELGCKDKDAFILIVADLNKAKAANAHIITRLSLLCQGVPKEVRKANEDGTSTYLRPMPGAARMYPETDVLPVNVGDIKVDLPELLIEKVERYQKDYSLGKDMAEALANGEEWTTFESLVTGVKKPVSLGEMLLSIPKQLEKKHNISYSIALDDWKKVIAALDKGKLTSSNVVDVFAKVAKGSSLKQTIASFEPLSEEETKKIITKVKKQFPDGNFGLLMGKVMSASGGKADGKLVSQLLKK